ncbi:MAG TPA: MarR family transcriptional regulator [Polyangiaceae bacterium]|nr:MarR family transcriptional regulator [Polyangiaceae bacterium]
MLSPKAPPPAISEAAKPDVDAVVEAIVYLYTESRRLTKEVAARYGLTGPQLTVVKMLEALGDLSLSRLSEKIKAQNSTVTGIVDRMEREGLVARARSATDRRVVHIKLTPKGARLAREVPVEPMEIVRQVLLGLSEAETQELLRILTKLARGVKALVEPEGAPPPPPPAAEP